MRCHHCRAGERSGLCIVVRLAAREANHNAEEGTVDLEFHGEEGITSNERA